MDFRPNLALEYLCSFQILSTSHSELFSTETFFVLKTRIAIASAFGFGTQSHIKHFTKETYVFQPATKHT